MQIDRPIAIALILFAVLALVFFLVMPEYKTFQNLQLELGKKIAEYNAEFAYYNQIAAAYQDLQNRKDNIKKIDDALPTEQTLSKIIYYLQKTASENGMILKNLFISKSGSSKTSGATMKTTPGSNGGQVSATSQNTMNDVTFTLSLTGDYLSLENFMVALEKSSRVFEITTVSFGSSGGQGQVSSGSQQIQVTQTYNFNLGVKTHSY